MVRTCGDRYWTTHCGNLQHGGKVKVLDFDLRLTIAEHRRDGRALLGMVEFFTICVVPMTCVQWLSQMERLSRTLKDMTDSIDRLGMQWKEKSLAMVAGPYTSYKAGEEIEITSSNGKKWKCRVVDGMEALGTCFDARGCSEAGPWHRIAKANSLFHANQRLLCDPKIPVKRRIHAFLVNVRGSSAAWCRRTGYTQSVFQALRTLGAWQAQTCLMPTQKGNRDLGGLHEADRTSGGEAAEETQPARHSRSCIATCTAGSLANGALS